MKKPTQLTIKSAFSLVELLVVIAVIAIIAAIAIPNIAGITGAANTSKNQRNAQNIASVWNSAIAAGHSDSSVTSAQLAAEALTNSITIPSGAVFRVDGMGAGEVTEAVQYLGISGSQPSLTLVYRQTTN